MSVKAIRVLDSHTGGEPTRVIVDGGPDLGSGTIQERLEVFRSKFDHVRSAVVNEPRGSDVLVGALYLPADQTLAHPGVIFFNNVGYLGMCGHGTIGLLVTLHHLGWLPLGKQTWLTPVGPIEAELLTPNKVRIRNVTSYRTKAKVAIDVAGLGVVRGDIAWGGNWFFLVDWDRSPIDLQHVEQLTEVAWKIRQAVNQQGYPEIDHIELFGKPSSSSSHSKNFVLCPGKAFDRSPCGTGTSAKLACLAADGKLDAGQTWIQESIINSTFEGSFHWVDRSQHHISPEISGEAYVISDSNLILSESDPFCWGIH